MEFDTIYKTYWPKIYRVCLGYLGDEDWAKDAAQDSFITVWGQLANFRQESAVSTWIYRIAVNTCLRQIEKRQRLPKADFPEQLAEMPTISNEARISFLHKYISELKELDRIIISLELEDVRQAEIAAIVGISEGNVRIKIHRIKEKITEKFKCYEGD